MSASVPLIGFLTRECLYVCLPSAHKSFPTFCCHLSYTRTVYSICTHREYLPHPPGTVKIDSECVPHPQTSSL